MVLLDDGELAVADGGSQELRVFGATGRFLRLLSRRGDGPGELRNLRVIAAHQDSLLVLEAPPAAPRLHVFHRSTGFVRRELIRPSDAGTLLVPLGVTSSRAILVSRGAFRRAVPPPLGKLSRDTLTLGVLPASRGSRAVSWIGTFANNSWYSYRLANAAVPVGMARYSLGPSLLFAVTSDRIWIGDSGTGRILVFDGFGRQLESPTVAPFSRSFDSRALQSELWAALADERDPDTRSRVEALYSPELRPAAAPAFSRLLPGHAGELWVLGGPFVSDAAPSALVLDQNGDAIARVELPPRFTPHAIGRDRLAGVLTDDDGLEQVVIFRLRR